MLKREVLIANESLKDLSEEQIKAIETLSENDENAVIGTRFGEVYRQMDATIEASTGIKRNGDEKTYLYLDRATKEFASKYGDYEELKSKVSDLEAQVAKGGDEALKAQLEGMRKELNATKETYNALKIERDNEKANYEKSLNDYKIDNEIARAREAIKLKGGFSDAVIATLVERAVANVKAKNPSFEVRDGGERLIFHDENGAPLNNGENQLNPFTAKELLIREFESMDILDKAPTKGAGGKQTTSVSGGTHLGATTREEANEIITKALFDKGIAKTDLRFQDEYDALWRDNKIDELPLTK